MNAMIFAAGLGTRLKPLTDHCPKALVKVEGKSLLEHNILKLKDSGFDHIVVNIHHFGDQIIDFLREKNNFGIDIKVSDERSCLLDTGGGILQGIQLFDNEDPILIHNVDIISTIDLREVYQYHIYNNNDATLCVSNRETSRYLLFDENNVMTGWTNIKTGEIKGLKGEKRFAFSGIHVISQTIKPSLTEMGKVSFPIMDYYISNCRQKSFIGFEINEKTKWVDCGKPDSLLQASNILKNIC